MKLLCILVVVVFLTVGFAVKADVPVFGNTTNGLGTAFEMDTGAIGTGQDAGGVVGFTPLENLEVTSVTLWLENYMSQTYQGVSVSLWGNEYNPSTERNQPSLLIGGFTDPTPNDGTAAAFTFSDLSGPLVLDAGQEYWLFAVGSYPGNQAMIDTLWMSGGVATGDADYDSSLGFVTSAFYSSSAMPAFTINVVPEPGLTAFASLALLLGIGRVVSKRIKNRA